ncbi:hypothetical protein C5E23_09635 [Pectobacterium parmentieri]|nr:hypothetical protein C5E25_09665 [Pectobacterium parmentieri]AYH14412.1 hypothetical protein C5E23_09635 [Pectobacterium parmentieri]AYH23114.1 hypothetical protein C5E21_09640 [Pectobacterium parmentieri]
MAAFKYSAHRGPRPEGPLQAAFKSTPGRFVTRITYLSKLIGTHSLAACLKLELFRVYDLRLPHVDAVFDSRTHYVCAPENGGYCFCLTPSIQRENEIPRKVIEVCGNHQDERSIGCRHS